MPIYEFQCKKCGASFELLVRASEKPICPQCASEDVGRLMSAPASSSHAAGNAPCGQDCGGERAHSCCCSGHCCHH